MNNWHVEAYIENLFDKRGELGKLVQCNDQPPIIARPIPRCIRSRPCNSASNSGRSSDSKAAVSMHSSDVTALALLRRTADRLTDWRFHCWYWGDAIAIDGLIEAHALGAGTYRDHVLETLQRWHRHCLPNFDDALAPGAAIIRLVMDGDLPARAGERVLDRLQGLPPAYGAVPALEPHRPFFRYGLCIDAVYHLPATYATVGTMEGR